MRKSLSQNNLSKEANRKSRRREHPLHDNVNGNRDHYGKENEPPLSTSKSLPCLKNREAGMKLEKRQIDQPLKELQCNTDRVSRRNQMKASSDFSSSASSKKQARAGKKGTFSNRGDRSNPCHESHEVCERSSTDVGTIVSDITFETQRRNKFSPPIAPLNGPLPIDDDATVGITMDISSDDESDGMEVRDRIVCGCLGINLCNFDICTTKNFGPSEEDFICGDDFSCVTKETKEQGLDVDTPSKFQQLEWKEPTPLEHSMVGNSARKKPENSRFEPKEASSKKGSPLRLHQPKWKGPGQVENAFHKNKFAMDTENKRSHKKTRDLENVLDSQGFPVAETLKINRSEVMVFSDSVECSFDSW